MTPDEAIDPAERELEHKIDPVLEALIARGLKEGIAATTSYAQRLSEEAFWPIGLCVAWVLGRERPEAGRLYARHRLTIGVLPVDSWIDAQVSLLRALANGKIGATGVAPEGGPRVSIPAYEWIDLRIQQRGQFDEVRRADGPIAYLDVRIAAAAMKKEWPVATPAKKTLQEKAKKEKDCKTALMERMRASPEDPVTKKKLKPEFPDVSGRAFNRLYSQAVDETGCLAWSKRGRRPQKRDAN